MEIYGFSVWLAAYLVAEFWLQPAGMARWRREECAAALLHLGVVAGTLWLFAGWWGAAGWVLMAAAGHGAIEWVAGRWAGRQGERLEWFVAEQMLHLVWLAWLTWLMAWGRGPIPVKWWWMLSALVLLTQGGGSLIERMLERYMPVDRSGTIPSGGRWTGCLERLLVALCMASGVYEGIGFLIAAKSILRFREAESDKRRSEYVLIGTMASFLWAILVCILLQKALKNR